MRQLPHVNDDIIARLQSMHRFCNWAKVQSTALWPGCLQFKQMLTKLRSISSEICFENERTTEFIRALDGKGGKIPILLRYFFVLLTWEYANQKSFYAFIEGDKMASQK